MGLQKFSTPILPMPAGEVTPEYIVQVIRALNTYLQQVGSTTPIVVDSITLLNLPTSATGLASGTVWNDAGTLKIVP